jgi:GT2 family glycosyltransferase
LASLARQTFPAARFEIVVVDDFSEPELRAAADEFVGDAGEGIARVQYIRNPENQGRAKTRNRGVAAASGEIVLFMDVDHVADAGLLAALDEAFGDCNLKSIRANSSVWPPSMESSAYLRYYNSRLLGKRTPTELSTLDLDNLPAKYFATGCMAVTRAALDAVGGFDEQFRHYGCEDEDLGARLEAAGVPLAVCLSAKAYDAADDLNVRRICTRFIEYARVSVPIMLRKHPSYARQMPLWFLEVPISQLSAKYRAFRAATIALFRPRLARLLVTFLEQRDKKPGFNPPSVLYKLAIAGYYVQGYRLRKHEVST